MNSNEEDAEKPAGGSLGVLFKSQREAASGLTEIATKLNNQTSSPVRVVGSTRDAILSLTLRR